MKMNKLRENNMLNIRRRWCSISVLILAFFNLLAVASIVAYHRYSQAQSETALYIALGPDSMRQRRLAVDVHVDGVKQQHARSDATIVVRLRPGRHVVELIVPGYVPHREVVNAPPRGGESYLYATLKPELRR